MTCFSCDARFNVIRRKHHCRGCGKVSNDMVLLDDDYLIIMLMMKMKVVVTNVIIGSW